MNSVQVCLVLVASCTMLASADPTSYKFGYSDQSIVELDAPALGLAKDCDPLTSSYLVTGSTPAPAMRTAVEIEPARIMSVTASPLISTAPEYVSVSTPAPILRTAIADIEPARIMSMTASPAISTASEYLSVSTPAPILRSAIDIEPARIINAAPLKLETRIAASPLLDAFRPAVATFDSAAWHTSLENASPAPIALKTITKTTNVGSTIISSESSATAAPQFESKMFVQNSAPIIAKPLSSRILPLPTMSSSYSYAPQTYASSYLNSLAAPQYYSTASKYLAAPQYYSSSAAYAPQYYSSSAAYAPQYYAPQYYSSSAAFAPQYYSSFAAYAPQYYSSSAAYAPQYYSSSAAYVPQYYSAAPKYYSSVSVAADEPCDK